MTVQRLVFILPDPLQEEELPTRCLRPIGEEVAGGSLEGPTPAGEKRSSRPHLFQSLT